MLLRLTESSIRMSLSIFSVEKKVNCVENWKRTNSTMEGFQKITCHRFFHWMPEQICRGLVADVGFDVVCYNIEKGNRFCLSDR